MSFEGSGLSLSSGLLIAAGLYIGGSFLAGQVIAKRQIEFSGWQGICEIETVDKDRAEQNVNRRPREIIPEKRCNEQLDGLPPIFGDFRTVWNGVCDLAGNPDLYAEARRAEEKLQREIDEIHRKRQDIVRAGAGSQCECAANEYLLTKAVPLAVNAGSLRMISLPAVSNRDAELRKAALSPACAAFTEARP